MIQNAVIVDKVTFDLLFEDLIRDIKPYKITTWQQDQIIDKILRMKKRMEESKSDAR